jgi:A/G-specific adenine glycosylase
MDKNQPGDFNQAMMELGALICKPQNPLCDICPVSEHCLAFEQKEQDKVPVKKGKVKVKKVHFNYMVFHTEEELLIEKRNSGIWKGLYQFPLIESDLKLERKDVYDQIRVLGFHDSLKSIESEEYKHILSHRIIYARFYLIEVTNLDQIKGYLKISKSAIEQYPLPQLIVKFLSSKSAKQNLMYIVD